VKIGIAANPSNPTAVRLAQYAAERLRGHADVVIVTEGTARTDGTGPVTRFAPLDAEVLVSFGGDGTFLFALQEIDVPILPINAGTIGFLAEVDGRDPKGLDEALDRLLLGRYRLEQRMRLAAQVEGVPLPDAVNEVVVHTAQVAKMRAFAIAVDGEHIGRLRADGIIASTPTGSTSYALSANGPIVEPTLDAILLTALAPFRSIPHALVLDPLRTVRVHLELPEKHAIVVVDGQTEHPVSSGGTVVIHRSPRRARFVRFGSTLFRRVPGRRHLPWGEGAGEGLDANLPPPP
jgi:NAD+ kinase